MKSAVFALLSAAVAVAAEQHMHHGHQHLHEKRDPTPVIDDVVVPGPTVIVWELNGKTISEQEVDEGIKNGTLIYAANGAIAPAPSTYTIHGSTSTTSSSSSSSTSTAAPPPPATTHSTTQAAPATSSQASSNSNPGVKANIAVGGSSSSSSSSSTSGGQGVDSDFPDGTIDCSTFPSAYGAVAIDWLNVGGWTGVQIPGSTAGGYSNIMTQTSGTCSGSNCCSEGAFCSYACPAGYQKSQWPATQGATGQSIGGLQCLNGKLHLTNSALSSKLCIKGASQVNIQVTNKLSQNVAICLTDYPGTEGMYIPVDAQPGTTNPLTCPDSSTYYHWQGGQTSAQYYINPAGVPVSTACTWGSASNPWGNFSPMNLGVGYSAGQAWLSIFPNLPSSSFTAQYTVEIVGDNLSGSCKYSNGQYCSATGCTATGGCTVSLASGTATYVIS